MSTKVTVVECQFSGRCFELPFSEKETFRRGDRVIFKDEDGEEEYGIVKSLCVKTKDKDSVLFNSKILRVATAHDLQRAEGNIEKMSAAVIESKKLVDKYALDMQVFRAGYSFDSKKLHLTFTADDRVDFRELVKDLAKAFKKQIYLRQVGPRDRATMLGGFGRCGRVRCSTTFLRDLESINMDMVRVQGLEGRGSSKLSGPCGKLLCCLKFEVDTYKELRSFLPSAGDRVILKKSAFPEEQEGDVIGLDILNQKIRVILKNRDVVFADGGDVEKVGKNGKLETFNYDGGKVLKSTGGVSKVDAQTVETFMDDECLKLTKV
jgi:cell fate regulator YaaT (PSP1 superfamily)